MVLHFFFFDINLEIMAILLVSLVLLIQHLVTISSFMCVILYYFDFSNTMDRKLLELFI